MLRAFSRTLHALRSIGTQLHRDEQGSIVSFLVVIPVLVGAVAIGVETGQLYRIKRQMQAAADAAAIAGSIDRLADPSSTTIVTSARYEAQRNGFTDGTNGVVVTVNSPPSSGPNIGTTGAVEVIVTKNQAFSLGAVINNWMGVTNSGFTMRARSVGAQGSYTQSTTSNEGCIVALTPAAEQGVSITSFNNFVSDCSILSNGTATVANSNASIYMAGFNNATIHKDTPDRARIWTRGSFRKESYNSFTADDELTNQSTSIVDPYAGLATPAPGTCSYTNFNASGGSETTLVPGNYCGGLTISGTNNVYFTAGTYYISNGDLYITGVNNVSCSNCTGGAGVTIVLTQTTGNNADIGGVRIVSENNVTLNAPNSGTYAGVLFYQDRNVAAGTMTSTSKIFTLSSLNNATLYGAVYFPKNRIDISSINNFGGNSTTGCTVWIGRYIKFTSYNNNFRAGCPTYGTKPAGLVNATTINKPKVLE